VARLICILLVGSWWLVACAGKSHDEAPMSSAGGADVGIAGSGSLLPAVVADGGAESFAPSAVACAGTPGPAPGVTRACVLAASCLPRLEVSLAECISESLPASPDAPPCWLGAGSCTEVAECFGFSVYKAPCASADLRSTCDENHVVTCDLPRTSRDCRAVGGICQSYSSFPNDAPDVLDSADCAVETTCTETNDRYACDGSKRFRCRAGVAFGEDCAARGMVCANTADGAACVATGPRCPEPGVGRCIDDEHGRFCASDGRVVSIDCAALGFTCREAPERLHGVRCDSPSCTPTEVARCIEECDGSTAHLCLGGQRYSVDCRAFGLKGCLLDTRPGVGDTARCGNE
jgi:hypothetical protein